MSDRPPSKSLWRLLQLLRPTPLGLDQQVILATQVATWVWLAAAGKIPSALAPDVKHANGYEIRRVLYQLHGLHPELGGNADAFITDVRVLDAVPEVVLSNLLHEARQLVAGGFVGAEFVNEILLALAASAGRTGLFTLPQELVHLLAGLADINAGDEIYTPFDDALQLSLAAAQAGAEVFAELQSLSPLPYLINLLADQQIHVNAGRNPISNPSFTDGPRLKAFARTMSIPPMGMRFPLETIERDLYGRFRERTSSSSVLAVRHILAQTAGRAIIVTPNNLLFGAGAERSVREDLVHGGLEAVIALPPATLFGTAIPLAILVVNTRPPAQTREVLFVDGSAERFHKRDGKGRSTLVGWSDLVDLVQQRQTDAHATLVPAEVIASNDYQLMVSRYARSQQSDAVDAILREAKTVPLEDLVEFIRPVPLSTNSDADELAVQAREVGVFDLPEYGYIGNPQKMVRLPDFKNVLRPLDIVIAVKGNVGKVGIAPPELTETWVAGQSCLILRLRPERQSHPVYTPQSLLLYLRSALGKASLARITSGGTVPLIQLRELRRLALLVPSLATQDAANKAFEELVELQQQIEAIRDLQQELSSSLWQLPVAAPSRDPEKHQVVSKKSKRVKDRSHV